MLRYGYVSNGFVQHRLDDALGMLADAGYAGLGLTLDPHHFDPFSDDIGSRTASLLRRLQALGLSVVVETGASFLLDPRRKHEPTLVSAIDIDRRIDFLRRAVDIAQQLGAEAVSFWSGVVHDQAPDEIVWGRLVPALDEVVAYAAERRVPLAFEPEPGMFIDCLDRYEQLCSRVECPEGLGLTLDVGHVRCNEASDEATVVRRMASQLRYVQIDDMRQDAHIHLDFGKGEVNFPAALAALNEVAYSGLVSVELSRHSHVAHQTIPRSIDFLRHAEGWSAPDTA